MNIEDIYKVIEKIDKSSLSYFELSLGECKVKIDKSLDRPTVSSERVYAIDQDVKQSKQVLKDIDIEEVAANSYRDEASTNRQSINEESLDNNDKKDEVDDKDLYIVKSPIVGTYYDSASPDSDKYVEVGSRVSKGDTLCIIESMKLMNEIESEVDGEVVEILVNKNAMVEFGQPLFKIRSDKNA